MIKESLTDEVAQERSLAFIRPAIRKFIIEKKPGKKIAEFQAAAMQSDLLLAPSFNVGVWPAHASSLRVRAVDCTRFVTSATAWQTAAFHFSPDRHSDTKLCPSAASVAEKCGRHGP
jgi:hypothetical protein